MQDTSLEEGDLYLRLMKIGEEALAGGYYETAFHALNAALHYAQSHNDEQRLRQVEQTAKAHQSWVDTHSPEHRMSTQAKAKRHGTFLYDMLARQAAAQVLIVQQKHRRDNAKPLPWFGDEISKLS